MLHRIIKVPARSKLSTPICHADLRQLVSSSDTIRKKVRELRDESKEALKDGSTKAKSATKDMIELATGLTEKVKYQIKDAMKATKQAITGKPNNHSPENTAPSKVWNFSTRQA